MTVERATRHSSERSRGQLRTCGSSRTATTTSNERGPNGRSSKSPVAVAQSGKSRRTRSRLRASLPSTSTSLRERAEQRRELRVAAADVEHAAAAPVRKHRADRGFLLGEQVSAGGAGEPLRVRIGGGFDVGCFPCDVRSTIARPSLEAINFAVAVEPDVHDALLGVAQESADVGRHGRFGWARMALEARKKLLRLGAARAACLHVKWKRRSARNRRPRTRQRPARRQRARRRFRATLSRRAFTRTARTAQTRQLSAHLKSTHSQDGAHRALESSSEPQRHWRHPKRDAVLAPGPGRRLLLGTGFASSRPSMTTVAPSPRARCRWQAR